MMWLNKIILILIIYCIVQSSGEKLSNSSEEIIQSFKKDLEWNFHPESIVVVEPPSFQNDRYTYIECHRTDYEFSQFHCNVTVERRESDEATIDKKTCRFNVNVARDEVVKKVWLKSTSSGKIAIGCKISKLMRNSVAQNLPRYHRATSALSILKIFILDASDCRAAESEDSARIMSSDHVAIVPYNDTFDLVTTNIDLDQCVDTDCIFKFDSEGKLIGAPVPLLPNKVFTEYSNELFVYPISPRNSSRGYFVVVRDKIVPSHSKIHSFREDGSERGARNIFDDDNSDAASLAVFSWSQSDDNALICTHGLWDDYVYCRILDENLGVKFNTTFYVDDYQYLKNVRLLKTGEILLWSAPKTFRPHDFEKVYVTDPQRLPNYWKIVKFNEMTYSARPEIFDRSVREIFEMDAEVCFSVYRNSYDDDLSNREKIYVNKWSVKCVGRYF